MMIVEVEIEQCCWKEQSVDLKAKFLSQMIFLTDHAEDGPISNWKTNKPNPEEVTHRCFEEEEGLYGWS